MTRWAFAAVAALLVAGGLAIVASRLLGRSDSRASVLVAVLAQWIAAYVLWSFAGGLAVHYGLLGAYEGRLFAVVALAGGVWHYQTAVRLGRERGRAVFVGAQFMWLVIVLVQNGVFRG